MVSLKGQGKEGQGNHREARKPFRRDTAMLASKWLFACMPLLPKGPKFANRASHLQESPGSPGPKSQKKVSKRVFLEVCKKKKSPKIPQKVEKNTREKVQFSGVNKSARERIGRQNLSQKVPSNKGVFGSHIFSNELKGKRTLKICKF